MVLTDIQARLAQILAVEEAAVVDWGTVDRLCDQLDRELEASKGDVPEVVAHFLSDSDIRVRDPRYSLTQRDAIRTYLANGDYFDGVGVSWWGCAVLVALVSGAIWWAMA